MMRGPSLTDRVRGWRRRLGVLLHPKAADRGMSAELEFHRDMETEKNVAFGLRIGAAFRKSPPRATGADARE